MIACFESVLMIAGTRNAVVTRYVAIAVIRLGSVKCGSVTIVAPADNPRFTVTIPYN
jgi:hypothetical protein